LVYRLRRDRRIRRRARTGRPPATAPWPSRCGGRPLSPAMTGDPGNGAPSRSGGIPHLVRKRQDSLAESLPTRRRPARPPGGESLSWAESCRVRERWTIAIVPLTRKAGGGFTGHAAAGPTPPADDGGLNPAPGASARSGGVPCLVRRRLHWAARASLSVTDQRPTRRPPAAAKSRKRIIDDGIRTAEVLHRLLHRLNQGAAERPYFAGFLSSLWQVAEREGFEPPRLAKTPIVTVLSAK